jgi:hypothetical protein
VVANAIPITTLIFFAALEVPVSTITMGAPIRFNYRANGTMENVSRTYQQSFVC